jgi:hypothetical protein
MLTKRHIASSSSLALLLLCVTLGCNVAHGQPRFQPQWLIGTPSLTKHGETTVLQLHVVNKSDESYFDLTDIVALTTVDNIFVYRDRLTVMGKANNVNEVIIFDLSTKRQIDAFYCYQPARISDSLLVYVEWSPNHTPERVTDVVLIYDLASSPNENRLGNTITNDSGHTDVRVGMPIYPESNFVRRSYANVVADNEDVTSVVGLSSFIMLESKRLVFISATGSGDFRTLHNYLVAIDLTNGIRQATINIVPIPKNNLKRTGENPEFIQVSQLQAESAHSVRLLIPEAIYGVGEIIVPIP